MHRTFIFFASLLLLAACAEGSAVTPGAAGPSGVPAGTPDSVLPDSPDAEGGATGGATGGTDAFVRNALDAHAASMVKASCAPGKLRLTLDGVLFDFDQDSLKAGSDDVLLQIKKSAVDAYPAAHIVVEGHTDNVGTNAHNDDLSARRAKTVVSWLEAHGVTPSRLEAKGYGKRWPRWSNDTEADRAKNRRVELIVLDSKAATSCNSQAVQPPPAGRIPDAPPGDGRLPEGAGAGHGGDDVVGQTDPKPLEPEAFSYLYNDHADLHAHSCFTTDPAWVPPGGPPRGYVKKDRTLFHDGQFVDHCPTEDLVATCDRRSYAPAIESYYRGMAEGALEVKKTICGPPGKWVRLVAAAATAKIQPDTATYPAVCDLRPGTLECWEVRADASPNAIRVMKSCATAQLPRCPTQGATGRCDYKEMIKLNYNPDPRGWRLLCEGGGGSFSAP